MRDGHLLVGSDPDAPVRVALRWLDGRDVQAALPPAGQAAVAGGAGTFDEDALVALAPVLDTIDHDAPVAPVPVVDHLSYSSLSRYERCGLRFHLERVAGLRERERPVQGRGEQGLDARARGSIVHRVLELHDLAADVPPTASDVEVTARELEVVVTETEAQVLAEYVARALETPLMGRVRAAARTRREATFTVPLDPDDTAVPVLLGIVDLVAEEAAGTTLVVDYKTDRLKERHRPRGGGRRWLRHPARDLCARGAFGRRAARRRGPPVPRSPGRAGRRRATRARTSPHCEPTSAAERPASWRAISARRRKPTAASAPAVRAEEACVRSPGTHPNARRATARDLAEVAPTPIAPVEPARDTVGGAEAVPTLAQTCPLGADVAVLSPYSSSCAVGSA